MKLFGYEIDGIPKLIVVFVLLLLVSSGLCGLQFVFQDHIPGAISGLYIAAGVVELGMMLVSAGAIVLLVMTWVVRSIYEQSAGSPPEDRKQHILDLTKKESEGEAPKSEEVKEKDDDSVG